MSTTTTTTQDHIVIFPFMAKGHTIPLLHLATSLAISRNLLITLITTPANAPFIHLSITHPNIRILILPFPHLPPLPHGCESTDHLPSPTLYPAFLAATALLNRPFTNLLLRLSLSPTTISPPLCLISDFFLGWTLPICQRLGIPRLVFHGMSAFSMALSKALWVHRPHDDNSMHVNGSFSVPGIPDRLRFTRTDVPASIIKAADPTDPVTNFINEAGASDVASWGVLVNSFAELEKDFIAPFEAFYAPGTRAWLTGPFSLLSETPTCEKNENECLQWLEGREAGSVVYVSFGTQTHVSDEQLDEVAHGLVESGCDFIWVVRSPGWSPPELTEKKGRVERGWAPQKEVLEHESVGGFVSHCGWNSVLESVSAGVPILTWPMMAEQPLNAKFLVEEVEVAIGLVGAGSDVVVGRREVCEGVRELMKGEKGRRVRQRAVELRAAAREAVAVGGSSQATMDELLEELRVVQRENSGKRGGMSEAVEVDGERIDVDASVPLERQDGIQTA